MFMISMKNFIKVKYFPQEILSCKCSRWQSSPSLHFQFKESNSYRFTSIVSFPWDIIGPLRPLLGNPSLSWHFSRRGASHWWAGLPQKQLSCQQFKSFFKGCWWGTCLQEEWNQEEDSWRQEWPRRPSCSFWHLRRWRAAARPNCLSVFLLTQYGLLNAMLISLEILCGPEEAIVIYASPLLRIEMREFCPVAGLPITHASENKQASWHAFAAEVMNSEKQDCLDLGHFQPRQLFLIEENCSEWTNSITQFWNCFLKSHWNGSAAQ